ncbi:MAG TPA: aminoglycoside phosphotransferase family protein [Roseiflexaceae bacterium]|nr:aminoglycoside phosphotransferase family protein [Roseiflexaceae bacterium]
MIAIPESFARTMVELHAEAGAAWLRELPTLLDDCAQRWSLTIAPPFDPLTYNYVAPAMRADGTPVVLKVGFASRELQTEIAALRLYDGHGIAQLLDVDLGRGAFLIERLRPGTPLFELLDDEQATTIAAQVMRKLWRGPAGEPPAEHDFPTVVRWAEGMARLRERFGGGTGPFPTRLVERAERLFDELLSSMGAPVLLHGDLHHWNILASERQPWLALDPKGVIGEPEYEVGAWLRNPLPRLLEMPQPGRVLARRLDIFGQQLGFDRARLIGWGFAQAVLSAWWSYVDHGRGWQPAMKVAELLAELE